MNMARSSLLITLLSATLAGGFIYFARPISAFVVNLFFAKRASVGPEIASASALSGNILIRRAYQSDFSKLNDGASIHHQDRLQLAANSDVILNFVSGYKIRLQPKTQAVLELYTPGERSPALLTINSGDFDLLTSGQIGQLFVSKDHRVFSPEAKPAAPSAPVVNTEVIQAKRDAETKKVEAAKEQLVVEDEPPLLSELDVKEAPPAHQPKLDKVAVRNGLETLTTAYIEDVFTEHSEDLRRCQMSSIRDNQEADGQILLSVTIEPTGRVNSVKVLQNKLKNDQLSNCVQSVVERTQFKPYAGEPITVTYPVEFR